MAKDYGNRRPTRQKNSIPNQALVILFSFLVGYLVATAFDIEKLTTWMNTQVLAHHEAKPHAAKPTPQHAQLPPKPKFEFYTLLANDKGGQTHNSSHHVAQNPVPTPSTAQVAAAKPIEKQVQQVATAKSTETKPVAPSPSSKSAYMVQVASFKLKKDADQMKALLTLKGYDVNVATISQAQGNWFRVIVGPYNNKSSAQQAQISLAKNERLRGMVKTAGG